jgi:hypothetical protein
VADHDERRWNLAIVVVCLSSSSMPLKPPLPRLQMELPLLILPLSLLQFSVGIDNPYFPEVSLYFLCSHLWATGSPTASTGGQPETIASIASTGVFFHMCPTTRRKLFLSTKTEISIDASAPTPAYIDVWELSRQPVTVANLGM